MVISYHQFSTPNEARDTITSLAVSAQNVILCRRVNIAWSEIGELEDERREIVLAKVFG